MNVPLVMLLIYVCDSNGQLLSPFPGTPDRALLFYIGLTMGIISSFLANKQEMEKLNKLLKQTENLVQDLHEELEMKDSLTVKELAIEDYKSQDVHKDSYSDDAGHALSLEQNCDEEYSNQKAEDESLSKIEAELEAELERLESTMNSSRLEGKLSNRTKVSIFSSCLLPFGLAAHRYYVDELLALDTYLLPWYLEDNRLLYILLTGNLVGHYLE